MKWILILWLHSNETALIEHPVLVSTKFESRDECRLEGEKRLAVKTQEVWQVVAYTCSEGNVEKEDAPR